jgi:(S)-ureidoglycine-glyoxylate aminotransferase
MGYNAMKHKVLLTLAALEACLKAEGYLLPDGAAVKAGLEAWHA